MMEKADTRNNIYTMITGHKHAGVQMGKSVIGAGMPRPASTAKNVRLFPL
jgi:hypothetical protein